MRTYPATTGEAPSSPFWCPDSGLLSHYGITFRSSPGIPARRIDASRGPAYTYPNGEAQ